MIHIPQPYNTTELTSTWTTKFAVFHPEISQDGKSEWSRKKSLFNSLNHPFDFPPILPFHQLGFSWNKRISLPKLCLLGALPTRVFGRELIWPFTPIQRNRFRHHHRFSGWCFRPDQKNMIVKMGFIFLDFRGENKKYELPPPRLYCILIDQKRDPFLAVYHNHPPWLITGYIPSRKLSYPPGGKGKSSSNMPYQGDMVNSLEGRFSVSYMDFFQK